MTRIISQPSQISCNNMRQILALNNPPLHSEMCSRGPKHSFPLLLIRIYLVLDEISF